MIRPVADPRIASPVETQISPLGIDACMFQLRMSDVFEFAQAETVNEQGDVVRLAHGPLRITVAPWGPKTILTGRIGPWMFACKDALEIERHYALPPRLAVHLRSRPGS